MPSSPKEYISLENTYYILWYKPLSSYYVGPADDRYIRAETCMFMIKLPQYSSLQIMSERLRYAVHCREDPLSG